MRKKQDCFKDADYVEYLEKNFFLSLSQKNPALTKLKFEETFLLSRNPYLCYTMAKYLKCANIPALARVVIESKDAKWNYEFALNVEGAKKEEHAAAVIKSGNPEYNYYFARYVKGMNIWAHGLAVLKSKDPKYNFLFARYVKDASIRAHEKAVLATKDATYALKFAAEIKGANIKAFEAVILNYRKPKYCYEFAKIPGANVKAHEDIIAKCGDIDYIYKFALLVPGANIIRLAHILHKMDHNGEYLESLIRIKFLRNGQFFYDEHKEDKHIQMLSRIK